MLRKVGSPSIQRAQPTAAFEEHPQVAATQLDLAQRAQLGGASSIMFLPQSGVAFEAFAFAYHTGLAKEMNLTGASGKLLRGTIVINVSGHTAGGPRERLLGFAERELANQGITLGDDAKRYLALRDACGRAFDELDRGRSSVELKLEGASLTIPRGMLDKLTRASLDSGDAELQALAELGNQAQRKLFGAENTYQVRIRTPDGKVTELAVGRNHPDRIELATRIPVELPLLAGETILEAWPTGSAEAAGYVEARRYRIHFGKDLFDAARAESVAESYQAAHPSIRWGTRHENDDLEAQQVSPSPRPYQDF